MSDDYTDKTEFDRTERPQSSVPAPAVATEPKGRWSDYAASEFGREEYPTWDAFYARMRSPILIEIYQQDWIPGFAAYYPSADYTAKPHVVLNIGSLMAAVDYGDILSKDLPYIVAERLMHEVIHVFEHWANEEFSEEKVEGLIMKYRELAGRGESAEQEQNKAGGEGETLIISSSALDERPADLEISWCVGRPRPVTPQSEPGPPIPKWIEAAATDIRHHIESVGSFISEETIRCLIFDHFCPKHEWEPDFSEEEPALDSKICGVCGKEHEQ